MTKKKRVYISGPISAVSREEAEKRFNDVQKKLEDLGYRVFNPMKNGLPYDAPTRAHMRRDLNELTNLQDPIDFIFMMRRWPHSSGCKTEHDTAIASGIRVIYEDSLEKLISGWEYMELTAVSFA